MADSQPDAPVDEPSTAPEVPAEPAATEPESPDTKVEAAEPGATPDPAEPDGATPPAEGEPEKKEAEPATPAEPDPKEEARKGFAERQQTKAQLARQLQQQFRPKSAEQFQEEGLDETQSSVEALRQEVALDKTINAVADLNANIDSDARAIESGFDGMFNEDSPNFDKEWAEQVSTDYLRDAQVRFAQHVDARGDPVKNPDGSPSVYIVSAAIPMYDYYQRRHSDRMRGASAGQVAGQKAAERMLASADTPTSRAPEPQAKDRLHELWDKD